MGTLYLCPTPIGNLEDITFRVISTLKSVDLIAAEDTRHTLKLLNHFDIKTPLTSYYEHNKMAKGQTLLDKLLKGENIALVSDAGTPAISDPGEDLVKLCIENGVEIIALPGATALISALIVSGLSTKRFAFEGFLTTNKKNRKAHLDAVKNDPRTLIFYEAPHKLKSTLADMFETFGERNIVLARELTKKFEEIDRTTLSQAIIKYEEVVPKGEFVLVVEGISANVDNQIPIDNVEIENELLSLLSQGISGNDASKIIAKQYNVHKRDVYTIYLGLQK